MSDTCLRTEEWSLPRAAGTTAGLTRSGAPAFTITHLAPSLFSIAPPGWRTPTAGRVETQTQNPKYKHPLMTHMLELGRFGDFTLLKNSEANVSTHRKPSWLVQHRDSAEVAATQGCVTDSDMEFPGSVDGGRPGLEFLFFSPNACCRKSDISCMSQAWVFLFLGKGVLLPCSPASLLVLIVILISKRVIGVEAWPFFRGRVFWLCGPCSATWIL